MASSKKRATKKTANKRAEAAKPEHKHFEVSGLVIVALGAFLFVSLFTKAAGPVGSWMKQVLLGSTGLAGYAIPMLIALLGVVIIVIGHEKINWWSVLAWSAFVVAGLALLNISRLDISKTKGFLEATVSAYQIGTKEVMSGGAVGGIALYAIQPLIGKAGTIIFLVLAMVVITVVNTGLSLRKLGTNVKQTADTVIAKQQQRRIERHNPGLFVGNVSHAEPLAPKKKPDLAMLNDVRFETTHQVSMDEERQLVGIDSIDFSRIRERQPEPKPSVVPIVSEDLPFSPIPVEEHKLEPKHADDPAPMKPVVPEKPALTIETDGKAPAYVKPPLNMLTKAPKLNENVTEEIKKGAARLEETLLSFGVNSTVVNVSRGPAVTRYELQPAPGVKISRIVNLSNDIALSMAAPGVRIEAPIPGKAAIGVEVPNTVISMVKLRDVLEGPEFLKAESALTYCLGKDIAGRNVISDLAKMPHMLIAGSTGSGKSVCINTLIVSILYKSSPEEVRMIMIDPKVVELNVYNGIPHLLIPVVTEPKKAAGALNWAVQEMTRRYTLFAEKGARDLQRYNSLLAEEPEAEKLPQIVIVIDELADLMMVAPNEVEDAICRLAQMARAAGMHLVIATQRPSVDVITGVIKANIPSRIAFAVSSQVDSRTILDMSGAEKLLGRGDMLFNPSGSSKPIRIQGAYITENEVEKVIEFIKQQHDVDYNDDVLRNVNSFELAGKKGRGSSSDEDDDEEDGYSERHYDALLLEASEIIYDTGQASISMVQRRLRVGYARAARLVDEMEELGIVSPSVGSKPREILKSRSEATQIIEQYRG